MKLYANNYQLAEQLLENVFALLRNEGLQPADCMALAYRLLADGIDVSPAQKDSLREFLTQALNGPRNPAGNTTETITGGNSR